MKKTLHLLFILFVLSLFSFPALSQAWEKNSKVLSLGVGTSKFFHLDDYYNYGHPRYHHKWHWHTTAQFNLQMEFGIHQYVGLGFTTGAGGRSGRGRMGKKDDFYYQYRGGFNIPIGIVANFHFYQLIADNSERKIHADRLDIYAGLNAGSGVAFTYYENITRTTPIAFGGLHAGIRYYFTETLGINGEFGWGKCIVNLGLVIKL